MAKSRYRAWLIGILVVIVTSGTIYLIWFWGKPLGAFCNEDWAQVSMIRTMNGTTGNGTVAIEYKKIGKITDYMKGMRLIKDNKSDKSKYRYKVRLFSNHGQVLNVTLLDEKYCKIGTTTYWIRQGKGEKLSQLIKEYIE